MPTHSDCAAVRPGFRASAVGRVALHGAARSEPSVRVRGRDGSLLLLSVLAAVALGAILLGTIDRAAASAPLAEPISVLDRVGPASFFSAPLGVAVDTTGGLLVIADTGNHRIRIFDLDGYPISSFPHRVDGPRGSQPGEPKALAVDRQRLPVRARRDSRPTSTSWTCSATRSAASTRPPSLPAGSIPRRPSSGGRADENLVPVALALDPEDRLVLAVGGQRSRVWALDEHDVIRWTLDGTEEGGAPFGAITDLFVDGEGRVFVVDGTGTPAVRVYAPDGRRLLGFGLHDVGNENFSLPTSVVTTPDGRIWVLDTMRQVIKVFDGEGRFLDQVGGLGRDPGAFIYPSALATNGKDRLYVVERVGARLTTFRIAEPVVQANPVKPRPGGARRRDGGGTSRYSDQWMEDPSTMKKSAILLAVVALVLAAPIALAGDFHRGTKSCLLRLPRHALQPAARLQHRSSRRRLLHPARSGRALRAPAPQRRQRSLPQLPRRTPASPPTFSTGTPTATSAPPAP